MRKMKFTSTMIMMLFASVIATSQLVAETTYETDEFANMSCESFLDLDSGIYEQVIYWIDGYRRRGNDDETFTKAWLVDLPVERIVIRCKETPKLPVQEAIDDINDDFSES